MSSLDDLAAAMNNRQLTDDDGKVTEEETSVEESAPQETNTEDDTATPEKAAEPEAEETKPEAESDETELAEDESGKRYVPEKRFKEVYANLKQKERDNEAKDVLIQELMSKGLSQKQAEKVADKPDKKSVKEEAPDKADILELRMTLPQFDPKFNEEGVPMNPEYSEALDKLGFQILKANPGITPLEAGRQALKVAKEVSKAEITASNKAREVKALSSDQGITSRVTSRGTEKVNPDKMSDQELEAYLRAVGQW